MLRRKVLGIELDGEGLRVVEVSVGPRRRTVRRAGCLKVSDDLARFLAEGRYTARRAAIGLAARHCVVSEVMVPSANPEEVAAALTLRAEHDLATAAQDLVLDYAGRPGGTEPVCLVAASRQLVERTLSAVRGAGLSVLGMTPSIMALGAIVPGDGALLIDRDDGADLLVRPWRVFHLPGPRDAALRQVSWTLGDADGPLTATVAVPTVDRSAISTPQDAARMAGAVAVALAAASGQRPVVDLLSARLSGGRRGPRPRVVALATAAALVLGAATIDRAMAMRRDAAEVAALEARLQEMAPDMEETRRLAGIVSRAAGWSDARPGFLDCLRSLALCFPEDGGIWTTSLAGKEDMRFVVTGAATDRRTILDVLDRLKASPDLADVTLLDMQGAGGEIRFTWGFTYKGGDR